MQIINSDILKSMATASAKLIPRSFFENDSVTTIAQQLLGKCLHTSIAGVQTTARIVETEAYAGLGDKACHAHLGRFTKRTKTMYGPGGTAYIYLCYGIHHLFNIVTNIEGRADAVLIRAAEPLSGASVMLERRGMQCLQARVTAGPGVLTQALGITTALNGIDLLDSKSRIMVLDDDFTLKPEEIESGPRVGIDYAGEDALLPWRYWLSGTKWKSPAK